MYILDDDSISNVGIIDQRVEATMNEAKREYDCSKEKIGIARF